MTISSEQTLLERINQLEGRTTALETDIERLKQSILKSGDGYEKLFDAIVIKQRKYRDCLTETMQVVMTHNKALFPERYVEGASPALRLSLDPSKMI